VIQVADGATRLVHSGYYHLSPATDESVLAWASQGGERFRLLIDDGRAISLPDGAQWRTALPAMDLLTASENPSAVRFFGIAASDGTARDLYLAKSDRLQSYSRDSLAPTLFVQPNAPQPALAVAGVHSIALVGSDGTRIAVMKETYLPQQIALNPLGWSGNLFYAFDTFRSAVVATSADGCTRGVLKLPEGARAGDVVGEVADDGSLKHIYFGGRAALWRFDPPSVDLAATVCAAAGTADDPLDAR
jgi:hypothetical protein